MAGIWAGDRVQARVQARVAAGDETRVVLLAREAIVFAQNVVRKFRMKEGSNAQT